MRRSLIVAAVLVVGGAAIFAAVQMRAKNAAAAAREQSQQQTATAAIPVIAATAQARNVPIILRGLGTVQAYNTVAIKSRVEGAVTKINFKEGQAVHAGDVLVQIDPRPFEAALEQAEAVRTRDQASLANAQTDLQRYAKLLTQHFTPEQTYTTQKSTVSQAEATAKNDDALVKAAQLNVEYATIRSPIDGVTGIRLVDLGNLVQANAQTLVVLTQIKPIYVIFTLPEADIRRIREAMAKQKLSVLAYTASDERPIATGVLDLVDNTVDQTTGTFKLKAEFPNADTALWPGEFVNAHLVLTTVHDGVTVPSAAVQTGPSGSFIYVVKADSTVDMRPVKVMQTENNVALIGSGLKTGERVVTSGQFQLHPGAKVQVSQQTAAAPPAGSSDTPPGIGETQ